MKKKPRIWKQHLGQISQKSGGGDISNDRQRIRKVPTKVQTVIKLVHCTLFVLQIVHRCDSRPQTVRLVHQITMAGDKVLSGDCRFACRNYFPDARKEIVACVTMARSLRRRYLAMETHNEFLHGTFLVATAFFFTSSPSAVRLPTCYSAVSFPPFQLLFRRFEARQSWSPPLDERVLTRN